MPIVGLLLEMSGAAALRLQFAVEAIFLGAPIKQSVGNRILLAGPTGREPLVGLRVGIQNVSSAEQPQAQPPIITKAKARTNQVRVFRNREKQKQPEMA
jgi:hypothetical protein